MAHSFEFSGEGITLRLDNGSRVPVLRFDETNGKIQFSPPSGLVNELEICRQSGGDVAIAVKQNGDVVFRGFAVKCDSGKIELTNNVANDELTVKVGSSDKTISLN